MNPNRWLPGLLAGALLCASTADAARGFKLRVRQSEAPDAPYADEVALYGHSYALVIGIDAYRAGWPRLSNAVNDARAVANALKANGFEVELKANLDSAALDEALRRFYALKGRDPDARLFVWFAGHGYSEGGEGFLIPADGVRPDKEEFRLQALSLRRFGEYVRLAKAKHALAVFDACFAGTVFDTQRALPPAAVTRATAQPVRQFIASGDAAQAVSDDGQFRELFLRALNGEERADANGDGYLTGSELGMYLSDRVTNLTQSRQTPKYGKLRDRNWDRGDFVFAVAAPPPPPPEPGLWDGEELKRKAGWATWLDGMRAAYRDAGELRGQPAVEMEAWTTFGKSFEADDPYSDEDERMREAATARLAALRAAPAPPPPAPGPAPGRAGIEWVTIPGGSFTMGSNDGENDEKPPHRVRVPTFEFAKSEVTVRQYRACVEARECTAPDTGGSCNWGESGREDHPVNCVSWEQARAFSAWAGGRLPSEAEWEYAARSGGKDRKYAWSDEDATCARAVMDDGRGNGCGRGNVTWPVCSKREGNSAQGVCDLAGNVWEWVEDVYGDYSEAPVDGSARTSGGAFRVVRGGSWLYTAGFLRAAYRLNVVPGRRHGNLGFRPAR